MSHFLYICIENGLKYTFLANFVKKSALNDGLNTINEHHTQDMGQYKHFQQFLDFHLDHRGVTGVISGGNLAQKKQKIAIFFVMLPIAINLNRCLNTINSLQAQDMDN